MRVRCRLSQALLDNLAIAWSSLDRARPRHESDVPRLLFVLEEWVRWAVRVDDELAAALGIGYVTARGTHAGGPPIAGVRHAHDLVALHGHAMDALVTVSAGEPALFYDVTWRRYEELPARGTEVDGEEAYRAHLATQPARMPASAVTTFLLTAAVAYDD
jgi:hypothetical protein